MLRQLALYYHKDANNLFMVRLAQVIVFSIDCLFVEILSARDVVPLDSNGI